MRINKYRILILISFLALFLFLEFIFMVNTSYAKFATVINGAGRLEVKTPILILGKAEPINAEINSKQSIFESEFYFKNYLEDTDKISEIDFEYMIKIIPSTLNFPATYKIVNVDTNEEILLNENLETNKIRLGKERALHRYKLVATFGKEITGEEFEGSVNVKLQIKANQIIENSQNANGGYTYENEAEIFNLTRNVRKPNYTKKYESDTWTKDDVNITITSDKSLTLFGESSFSLSEDGKTLTKVVTENEKGVIKVYDEDFNYDEIEYDVSWIDKEAPKIVGAENKKTYKEDLHLEYTDNKEVDEVFVDRYGSQFKLYKDNVFLDSGPDRFIPITKNTITAWVMEHPRGIEKYRYYLNGKLYATTRDTKYTFTDLPERTYGFTVLVEGLDRNDRVVAQDSYGLMTACYEDIILEKTETTETMKFVGISDDVKEVMFYTWIDGQYDQTLKYRSIPVVNGEVTCKFDIKDFGNRKTHYISNFRFYAVVNGVSKSYLYGCNIYMDKPYEVLPENPSINDFTVNGNYYVRVKDKAGNETEIDFTLQK